MLCSQIFSLCIRSGNNELIGMCATSLKDICPERFNVVLNGCLVSTCESFLNHHAVPSSLSFPLSPPLLPQRWSDFQFRPYQSYSEGQEEISWCAGIHLCEVKLQPFPSLVQIFIHMYKSNCMYLTMYHVHSYECHSEIDLFAPHCAMISI